MKKILELLSAPGVILHEIGHMVFCFFGNVKVFRVKLFGFGNPRGFVEHAEPETFIASTLITFGPLTFNTLISLVLFSLIQTPYWKPLNLVWIWVAFLSSLHAIPSHGDAHTLLSITNRKIRRNPFVVVGYPFIAFIYLLNFLRRLRLHYLYPIALFWVSNFYLK